MSKISDRIDLVKSEVLELDRSTVGVCKMLKEDIKYITNVLGNNGIKDYEKHTLRCPRPYCYEKLVRAGNKLVCSDCDFTIRSKVLSHKQLEFEHALLKQEVAELKENISTHRLLHLGWKEEMNKLRKLVNELTKTKGKKK